MKAIILAAMLATLTGASGAAAAAASVEKTGKLIKVYENRHGIPVYFDTESLYKGPDFIQIDLLSDHEPSDKKARSSTNLMRFKCASKEILIVDFVFYPEPGAKGPAIERALNPNQSFKPVEPGTEKEFLLKVACSL